MKIRLPLLAALAVAAGLGGPAAAQNYSQAPTYGSVSLHAGFLPDPHTAPVQAGGSIDVSQAHSGCRGYIASAPDYRLQYNAGSAPLIFSVSADVDTTLVVNAPNQSWHCDDDSGVSGSNPQVRFDKPQSGQYDIWVGTFSSGPARPSVLNISEMGSE